MMENKNLKNKLQDYYPNTNLSKLTKIGKTLSKEEEKELWEKFVLGDTSYTKEALINLVRGVGWKHNENRVYLEIPEYFKEEGITSFIQLVSENLGLGIGVNRLSDEGEKYFYIHYGIKGILNKLKEYEN